MEPTFPVVKDRVERIAALDQPEYEPLPFIVVTPGVIAARFELSEDEKQQIADGADIILALYTFGGPIQPSYLLVAGKNITTEKLRQALPD